MVVLNKIYTRTGDDGTTALGDGTRRRKDELRVDTYGTVDEVNSALGIAILHADDDLGAQIRSIQNDLFDLGADLCRPGREGENEAEHPPLRIIKAQVDRLETEIDAMNADLAPLRSFILPGGGAAAAHLHLARTITRRAERLSVALSHREVINPLAVKYLNRLSDWLFVASRAANKGNDPLWEPGKTRPQ